VDLEKAFDTVLREVIRWAMHKLGVKEWLVSAVMFMYYYCCKKCSDIKGSMFKEMKSFFVEVV